ncbi:hypothetical protein ACXJJ3_36755 [Kribbella sp. WER1]
MTAFTFSRPTGISPYTTLLDATPRERYPLRHHQRSAPPRTTGKPLPATAGAESRLSTRGT